MHPVNPAALLHYVQTIPAGRFGPLLLKGLLAVGVGLMTLPAHAQNNDLEVGVRSKVSDGFPHWNKEKTEAEGGHSMIYGILAIKQVDNERNLVRPVNEKRVVSILMDTLDANGFREFVPGEIPAILITASYGRGQMSNPYIRDAGEVGGMAGISTASRPAGQRDSQYAGEGGAESEKSATGVGGPGRGPVVEGPPSTEITGVFAGQLFDERGNGYEQKLQKAQFEKLFVRITAWSYPTPEHPRAKMLWKTIMVVDDPDHRDLNSVVAAMLEAGGPWFDKQHRNPEVEVHKPLPDGKVKVGTPEAREPFQLAPDK